MYDAKWIRENAAEFDRGLQKRGLAPLSSALVDLDKARRDLVTAAQNIQTERNTLSKQIGIAKSKGEDAAPILARVAELKDKQTQAEAQAAEADEKLVRFLEAIPNLPLDDVPEGADEHANREVRAHGNKRNFAFQPRQHFELGEALGHMDFERAAKLSGARFTVLSGGLARLERALGQFMLDLHTGDFAYTEVNPPLLVRTNAVYGTGQLPKFGEDLFRTTNDYWLIPTAEVPLTNLVADEIVSDSELPLRFTALTPCFRSEAGAAGKDTRGMIRQHQFWKVELVSIAHPDKSEAEHQRMTECAEEVLKRLGLHYRVMLLCSGDMGFAARKTYDIEVWLPGQNMYREISSCSNCGEFQARRMNARFKKDGDKGTRPVHTLNGSGLAVGRALIAVMENYQQEDGSILVPDVLQPYMGGQKKIEKKIEKAAGSHG